MQELTQILRDATEAMEEKFFRLPIDGGTPVYLERVYCYELYHQMRRLWPEGCPLCLNGEVDKRGHQKLQELGRGAAEVIPDLLVHGPGHMGMNHAIIEVKRCRLDLEGIQKDVGTLSRFLEEDVGYERGIFLVFGRNLTDHRRGQIFTEIRRCPAAARIELWHHREVGEPAAQIEIPE